MCEGFPRQHEDREGLLTGLRDLGVKGSRKIMTGDGLDAVNAALVGRLLLLGKGEMLGGKNDIVIPL
jgi:hypothetical protein